MCDCLICERINMIKNNKNPYFVRELKTGYVVIGDHQRIKGYSLFCAKNIKQNCIFWSRRLEMNFFMKWLLLRKRFIMHFYQRS